VALKQFGLTVTQLEPDERYPDSTFVEDTAILIGALPHGRASANPASANCAIITRPGAASRIGEVTSIAEVLRQFYPELRSIDKPGTLDGGDVCEAENDFFIGISERTNDAGAQQLAELLASFGYASRIIDIRGLNNILHLKSAVAYLGDNRLVISDALAGREEFCGYDLVRVSPGEEYAANCVRINGRVLVAAGYPEFEARLRGLGYQTTALEMSEFQKMDGGLSCLSLRF
jgi:dimethylargininase